MATLEITVRHKIGGRLVVHEKFEISPELAQELITKMEAMLADLPGYHRTTRTVRPTGITVVEIELNRPAPPPTSPTYEALFRSEVDDGPSG